ncbi:MAG: DUF3160 domain-containing protein [Planctomycetes bacterium]|jgi:hypothetical protein|nr:DUF3160 domain-containing protein [Planctomycetota bacterium]
MFEREQQLKTTETPLPEKKVEQPVVQKKSNKKMFIIGGVVFLIVIILLFSLLLILKPAKQQPKKVEVVEQVVEEDNSVSETEKGRLFGGLPTESSTTNNSSNALSEKDSVEYLAFSSFYKDVANNFTPKPNNYQLPLNVKTDVLNYYDVSRRLDLDPSLTDLNAYGFAVIPDQFNKDANGAKIDNDFYSLYNTLQKKQIPILITSDFLVYNYQNILKNSFKDIEEGLFYQDLWEVNRKLYDDARQRYEAKLSKIGNVNDPILEAERLVAAYFAVSLEILKPTLEQIQPEKSAVDLNKFSKSEGDYYSFNLPKYLETDVLREVKLIRKAEEKAKSPVLLYQKNYKDFIIPKDYDNVRLQNFYLCSKWLNSVFPIYYKGTVCPDCFLDKDDWRINFTTASFIAKDFTENSEIKNKWARIYKVIAFFKGLRSNLTYVHYRDSLTKLFGANYDIEKLFSDDNPEWRDNINKLQAALLQIDFNKVEGGFNKQDATERPFIGMKILADGYWPNEYLLQNLTMPLVSSYNGAKVAESNLTACVLGDKEKASRCRGIGFDIINLLYGVPKSIAYFQDNTNYQNYETQAKKISDQLIGISPWHNNNYWSTLKLLDKFLRADRSQMPAFSQSAKWNERNIYSALTSWVYLQVVPDKIGTYRTGSDDGYAAQPSEYSYIEPSLPLINEMLSNTEMLLDMFAALKINNELNSVAIKLNDLDYELRTIRSIVEKELSPEPLNDYEVQFINSLTKKYQVLERSKKNLTLAVNEKNYLVEDINGFKLLILVHKRDKNNVIAIGPVFDYQENKQ